MELERRRLAWERGIGRNIVRGSGNFLIGRVKSVALSKCTYGRNKTAKNILKAGKGGVLSQKRDLGGNGVILSDRRQAGVAGLPPYFSVWAVPALAERSRQAKRSKSGTDKRMEFTTRGLAGLSK